MIKFLRNTFCSLPLLALFLGLFCFGNVAHAEEMILVPVSTLKQLLAESNQQALILEKLEKNNSMQLTELAALKSELIISKSKLQKAENLSANAEKALIEANALLETYSQEQKAKLDKAQRKLLLTKRQRNMYCALGGIALVLCVSTMANSK